MKTGKKLALLIGVLVLVGGGVFYYLNSKDHYDPSKYSATITSAPPAPGDTAEAGAPVAPGTGTEVPAPQATGLAIGAKVELTLPDQFDAAHTIAADTTTLIMAFSKGSGSIVRGYLDTQPGSFLSDHKTVFIANISPIPVVIRNTLALPKLRKSSYSVLLLYEESMADALMNKEQSENIAVVTLESNVVQGIQYAANEADLVALIR